MKNLIQKIILLPIFCLILVAAAEPKLYNESFGDKTNPAIILNAGAGSQLITWDKAFCQKLAEKGYFVIRYDYRDIGLSDSVKNPANPYNALDLVDDAVGILKKYKIEKAHFVGLSMGGQVSQFAAAYMPEYVRSIILMATSFDFKTGLDAFEGIYNKDRLSPPNAEYTKFILEEYSAPGQTDDMKIENYVKFQRWVDGHSVNFDAGFARNQGVENLARSTKNLDPYSPHSASMRASIELHSKAYQHIKVPALIIHGAKDPIFGLDHAYDMEAKIANSELVILDDFGHTIQPRHFDMMANLIDNFIRKQKNPI